MAALFGVANHRWLRLPPTVGLAAVALLASFAVMLLDRLMPGLPIAETVRSPVRGIDFHQALMDGMLSFLLFVGAPHIDLGALRRERRPIGMLAAGCLAYRALWAVAEYAREILVTLALLAGSYALAHRLGVRHGMTADTPTHLLTFW